MKTSSSLMLIALIIISLGIGFYLLSNRSELSALLPITSPSASPLSSTQPTASAHPLISLATPLPGEKITSPLKISGQARGNWYFEATFPVVLTDWDGHIIAEGYATAQGEWMTEDFVPFTAELSFEKPAYSDRGNLILQKSNPSDLPENDDAYEMTVMFE